MDYYKIFVLVTPASGHMNPLIPILNEINKDPRVKIIVFINEKFKSKFESINVEVRILENFDLVESSDLKANAVKREQKSFQIIRNYLLISENVIGHIARQIDEEKPRLILSDIMSLHFTWIHKYYTACFENKTGDFRPKWSMPPIIQFNPAFMMCSGIYPNKIEMSLIFQFSFNLIWDLVKLVFTMERISFKYGLGLMNPTKELMLKPLPGVRFVMTTVAPDIHPRSHLYDKKFYKFIGSTVNDEKANELSEREPFKSLLESIEAKSHERFDGEKPVLVYASLGTVFNFNYDIYRMILDAFTSFDQEPLENKHPKIKFSNLRLIVSTGEKVYDIFKKMIDENKYTLPSNVTLVKFAPQIDVLKKASLFITHCGMNSTSESIHFAGKII